MVKSFKPIVSYQRSTLPIDCETVYKTSYNPIDCGSLNKCRLAPVRPTPNICVDPTIRMDDETVTKLSYPCPGNLPRRKPILPCNKQLFAPGPMQELTTQKHDYVPKPIMRRPMIVPKGMMQLTPLPLDCETIQKLSFSHPCNVVKTVSCKPIVCYQRPCLPMDIETTNQLSYSPICTPAKEIFPWAVKPCYKMPCVPIENETTYKLSYLGGAGGRDPLVMPKNNACMITCDVAFDDRTVYKESYLLNNPNCCRSKPIRPTENLFVNPDIKMDPETMYNLAYQGHYCVPKQKPILPCVQPMRGGPMQELTTQKHDYVCKPMCVRKPIKPKNTMIPTTLPLDCTTIAGSSYMCPTVISPAVSCKPNVCYKRPCGKYLCICMFFLTLIHHHLVRSQFRWMWKRRKNLAFNRCVRQPKNATNGRLNQSIECLCFRWTRRPCRS